MRIGLRFDRRDVRLLRELTARAEQREIGDHSVFALAAEAAQTGEPLIVECDNPVEVTLMAAGYVRFGVRAPVLEQLS